MHRFVLLAVSFASCGLSPDELAEGGSDNIAGSLTVRCGPVTVGLTRADGLFAARVSGGAEGNAAGGGGAVTDTALTSHRPALRAAPDPSGVITEYLALYPAPTATASKPADAPGALEFRLGDDVRLVGPTGVAAACDTNAQALQTFFRLQLIDATDVPVGQRVVGFDIDDTLLFSSATFTRGLAINGNTPEDDRVFWQETNRCDAGCAAETIVIYDGTTRDFPACDASAPKRQAHTLVAAHLAAGDTIYAITAREDINADFVRAYLGQTYGIKSVNVFFEPNRVVDGNAAGKTDRIAALGIDTFYGDADNDMIEAREAGATPVRFLRSPRSTNTKNGVLRGYHPGYFGEAIVADSYE